MEDLIVTIALFIIIYLFYVIFVINRKDKLNKLKKGTIVKYIVNRYKLDLKTINFKIFAHMIALTISFIISVTFFIISFFSSYFIKIGLCFIILIPFQYIMYMLIGKMYQKNHSICRTDNK